MYSKLICLSVLGAMMFVRAAAPHGDGNTQGYPQSGYDDSPAVYDSDDDEHRTDCNTAPCCEKVKPEILDAQLNCHFKALYERNCHGKPLVKVLKHAQSLAFTPCTEENSGHALLADGEYTNLCDGFRLGPHVTVCDYRQECAGMSVIKHFFRLCCTCCKQHVNGAVRVEDYKLKILEATNSFWLVITEGNGESCSIMTIGDLTQKFEIHEGAISLYCTDLLRDIDETRLIFSNEGK